MNFDIVLCGVGGQGGLSVASIIARSAMEQGLYVKQNEIHGMSQRGGAVVASLRISDRPIASDLIPAGTASMILSMEPLESLRYLDFLSSSGTLLSAVTPVKNISNYPAIDDLMAKIRSLPRAVLIEAEAIARDAGSARAANIVMVGAASNYLPIPAEKLESAIYLMFERKGKDVAEANLKAFQAGKKAGAGK